LARWSVDDYAVYDIPAMVQTIRNETGQAPWLVGHSLGVYSIEGFLGGIHYDEDGTVQSISGDAQRAQKQIRGVVFIAGVHNLWWKKSLARAAVDPVITKDDYFHSNYEGELLARVKLLYTLFHQAPPFPLSALKSFVGVPLFWFPWIGFDLASLYNRVIDNVALNPFMNLFYYTRNTHGESVRQMGIDGIEDMPMRVLEQLGNTIRLKETSSYFHLKRPNNIYRYGSYRASFGLPTLVVAGGHDRLASAEMIYQDGYQANGSPDKQFIKVEESGHLDILMGKNARSEVVAPVVEWLKKRN
jgi:pimeloyl-ACP methyl ester carboxylesterase